MKKILTIIALICFFFGSLEAKSNAKTTKKYSSKSGKKKVKVLRVGSCGSGLVYKSDGNIAGYWSCWESADGTMSITITRVGEL